jgi:hypothetical protein
MTFRSTLRFSLASRRKSWRVSANSRQRRLCRDRRSSLGVLEQGDLADEVAVSTGGDALALAGDVGLPFDYHEELLTGLALAAEHLAGQHFEVFGYPREQDQLLAREPSNSGGALQRLHLRVVVEEPRTPSLFRPAR